MLLVLSTFQSLKVLISKSIHQYNMGYSNFVIFFIGTVKPSDLKLSAKLNIGLIMFYHVHENQALLLLHCCFTSTVNI